MYSGLLIIIIIIITQSIMRVQLS